MTYRRLFTFVSREHWAFTLSAFFLLVAVFFLFLKLGLWALASALTAFVLLCLQVALSILGSVRRAFPHRLTRPVYRILQVFLLALALVIILHESRIELAGGQRAPPPWSETASQERLSQEDLVQFAGNFLLAKRLGVDTQAPPTLQATVDQPLDHTIEFTAPEAWTYRLAIQMTDRPFVDYRQRASDYLVLVGTGRTAGQTFRVSDAVTKLTGLRVKLEARSLPNNLPATSAPDAPLVATFSRVTAGGPPAPAVQVQLPPEEAGLNDAWRWVTIPFEAELSSGRTFAVEFTSTSEVIGWALAHVTSGFEGTDDFYPDGELFVNRIPYNLGGDLSFEVLGRNEQSAFPEVLVDEVPLSLVQSEDDPDWYVSQPVTLRADEKHALTVRSSNPHFGFYRFVFVQEQAPIASPVVEETAAPTSPTPPAGG